jgi:ferredoxin
MGAISLEEDGKSAVNQDECVECNTCYRLLRNEGYPPWFVRAIRKVLSALRLGYLADVDVCPTGAITPPELKYPRNLRAAFSDVTVPHAGTGIAGRGTEEIKTNEVTGRIRKGEAGIVVELGRPGIGATFLDVEKIAMALAGLGANFEAQNPVTQLMSDPRTGKMKEEVLGEKVLSAIIEMKVRQDQVPETFRILEDAQRKVDTVFSVGISSRCLPDGTVPHLEWVKKLGYRLSPNGKTNIGLGRPRFQED